MTTSLEFGLNIGTGQLSVVVTAASPQGAEAVYASGNQFRLPDFFAGTEKNFRIALLQDNPSAGPGAVSLIDSTGIGLRIGIGEPGAVLTSATMALDATTAPANVVFAGLLPFNLSAIYALFPGNSTAPSPQVLEIEVNNGGDFDKFQFPVTIRNEILTTNLVDPTPPDTALGRNEAAQLYMPWAWPAGRGPILLSPDGSKKAIVYLDNNGQLQVSPVA